MAVSVRLAIASRQGPTPTGVRASFSIRAMAHAVKTFQDIFSTHHQGMTMLVSNSVYSSRTPGPGSHCYSGGTASAKAAEQPAPCVVRESDSQPMDLVILWGPGRCSEELEAIKDAAINAELKY